MSLQQLLEGAPTQFIETFCYNCGLLIKMQVPILVSTRAQPELAQAVLSGRVHDVVCPSCKHFLLHDPHLAFLVDEELNATVCVPEMRWHDRTNVPQLAQLTDEALEKLCLGRVAAEMETALEQLGLIEAGCRITDAAPRRQHVDAPACGNHILSAAALITVLTEDTKGLHPSRAPSLAFDCFQALAIATAENRAFVQETLSHALERCLLGDRSVNSERSIAAITAALKHYTPEEYPDDWARCTRYLAMSYRTRAAGDKAANVRNAIEINRALLARLDPSSQRLARAETHLSLAYACAEMPDGEVGVNLAAAVQECQAALDLLSPADGELWDRAQVILSMRTIELGHVARDPWRSVETAAALGEVLQRIDRRAEMKTWVEASVYHALAIAESGQEASQENWTEALGMLEGLLHDPDINDPTLRALVAGNYAALMLSAPGAVLRRTPVIPALEEALAICELMGDRRNAASLHMNLGSAFMGRRSGDRAENVEHAITHLTQSLLIRNADTPHTRMRSHLNLASAYLRRVYGDETANVREARSHAETALSLTSRRESPENWARASALVAAATLADAEAGPNEMTAAAAAAADAEEVFRALGLTLEGAHAATVRLQVRLVSAPARESHSVIAELDGQARALMRAGYESQAASVLLLIADAIAVRFGSKPTQALERSRPYYHSALRIFIRRRALDPARRCAYHFAIACREAAHWKEASRWYGVAMAVAQRLRDQAVLSGNAASELHYYPTLFREAALARAKLGDMWGAVLALEHGRGQTLLAAIGATEERLDSLRAQHPTLYRRFAAAAKRLRQAHYSNHTFALSYTAEPEAPGSSVRARATAAMRRFSVILEHVRALPGFEAFLKNDVSGAVAAAVTDSQPLAYIDTIGGISLVLLVHRTTDALRPAVSGTLTGDLTSADLKRPGLVKFVYASEVGLEIAEGGDRLLQPLGRVMRHLAEQLRQIDAKRVCIVAGGVLGRLPLHAISWREAGRRQCLIDSFDVAFTPSASLLDRRTGELASEHSFLGVANPNPSSGNLPFAEFETKLCARSLAASASTIFARELATRRDVLAALPLATHVHFACHGKFEPREPLSSYIELANGERLTARDLIAQRPFATADLVVLASCETAQIEALKSPDDALSMAAACLSAGAARAVAALFPVDDRVTAILMGSFYASLRPGARTRASAASALSSAQRWLRDATIKELRDELKRLRELAPSYGETISRLTEDVERSRSSRPFSDLRYWGGFVLVGSIVEPESMALDTTS